MRSIRCTGPSIMSVFHCLTPSEYVHPVNNADNSCESPALTCPVEPPNLSGKSFTVCE